MCFCRVYFLSSSDFRSMSEELESLKREHHELVSSLDPCCFVFVEPWSVKLLLLRSDRQTIANLVAEIAQDNPHQSRRRGSHHHFDQTIALDVDSSRTDLDFVYTAGL